MVWPTARCSIPTSIQYMNTRKQLHWLPDIGSISAQYAGHPLLVNLTSQISEFRRYIHQILIWHILGIFEITHPVLHCKHIFDRWWYAVAVRLCICALDGICILYVDPMPSLRHPYDIGQLPDAVLRCKNNHNTGWPTQTNTNSNILIPNDDTSKLHIPEDISYTLDIDSCQSHIANIKIPSIYSPDCNLRSIW